MALTKTELCELNDRLRVRIAELEMENQSLVTEVTRQSELLRRYAAESQQATGLIEQLEARSAALTEQINRLETRFTQLKNYTETLRFYVTERVREGAARGAEEEYET